MYAEGPEGSRGGKGSQASLRPYELPHAKADSQQLARIVTQAASQPAIPRMANAGVLGLRAEGHAKNRASLKVTNVAPAKHASCHAINVLHAKVKSLSLSLAD